MPLELGVLDAFSGPFQATPRKCACPPPSAVRRRSVDDEHVISYGGLASALRLVERAGLQRLVGAYVSTTLAQGANAVAKVTSIAAGMACGADSIDDLDALRHGGMDKLFSGIRAPSTLGSFLHGFNWDNVRQRNKIARELLVALATCTPLRAGEEGFGVDCPATDGDSPLC